MLYFEDLQVGTVRRFGRHAVTREDVLEFARRYDPQPFHLSDEAAAQTHFGRLAASGWHTCAMTMAMLVENMAIEPQASLGAVGIDELRWLRPVHPGDVLRVETEILELRPSRSRAELGTAISRVTTFNQNDAPVLAMRPIALVRRRPR